MKGEGENIIRKVEVVLNTFTRDYFLSLMGPKHAEKGVLTWLVLTVHPAP